MTYYVFAECDSVAPDGSQVHIPAGRWCVTRHPREVHVDLQTGAFPHLLALHTSAFMLLKLKELARFVPDPESMSSLSR
jgi:hypothetical protein